MAQRTDTDLRELKDLIIGIREEIRADSSRLREEVRVGFANVDAKFAEVDKKVELGFANVDVKFANADKKIEVGFANIDTKFSNLHTDLTKLEGKIDKVDVKFDERTQLGFWGFIFRAVASTVLAAIIILLIRYLFPNLAN